MAFIINVITAWASVFLAILLAIIYVLRIINKGKKKNPRIEQINKRLRNAHKPMGIAFVVVSAIHGFLSSGSILSLNFGTACMAVGLLLGLTYWFRKVYKEKCAWIKPHRWLTGVLIVFLGLHLWEVGGAMGPVAFLTGAQREIEQEVAALYGDDEEDEEDEITYTAAADANSTITDTVVEKTNLFLGNVDLEDGIYDGVADGYGPDLRVSVTVTGNLITDIEIVSHNENNIKYYGRAIDAVPQAIIAAQNPVVDTISGATYTSDGIMKAVINALDQAVITGTLPSL